MAGVQPVVEVVLPLPQQPHAGHGAGADRHGQQEQLPRRPRPGQRTQRREGGRGGRRRAEHGVEAVRAHGEPRARRPRDRPRGERGQPADLQQRHQQAAQRAAPDRLGHGDDGGPLDGQPPRHEQRVQARQGEHGEDRGAHHGPGVRTGPAFVLRAPRDPLREVQADQVRPGAGLAPRPREGGDAEEQGGQQRRRGGVGRQLVRAGQERHGQPHQGVGPHRAHEGLPRLVPVGRAGQAPAGPPGQRERDQGQAPRHEPRRAGDEVIRRGGHGRGHGDGHRVQGQPQDAAHLDGALDGRPLEPARGPHREGGDHDRQQADHRRDERLDHPLQPQRQGDGAQQTGRSGAGTHPSMVPPDSGRRLDGGGPRGPVRRPSRAPRVHRGVTGPSSAGVPAVVRGP